MCVFVIEGERERDMKLKSSPLSDLRVDHRRGSKGSFAEEGNVDRWEGYYIFSIVYL